MRTEKNRKKGAGNKRVNNRTKDLGSSLTEEPKITAEKLSTTKKRHGRFFILKKKKKRKEQEDRNCGKDFRVIFAFCLYVRVFIGGGREKDV